MFNMEQQNTANLLLQFFKVMADENRLRLIGLLADDEYSVGELASLLNLTEPTISHHLAKLRALGLVNLRMDGNTHYYRLNQDMLSRMKETVFNVEQLSFRSDDITWIEALGMEEWEQQVLKNYTLNGRVKQLPMKEKKMLVILRWLIRQFEFDRRYSEREVNDILSRYHDDYATLRRNFIVHKFMEREADGSAYWRVR
jgi:predicted transcriptional regulator